jgi:hypothetical protein
MLLLTEYSTEKLYKWKAWQIMKNNMNKPAYAHVQVYSETSYAALWGTDLCLVYCNVEKVEKHQCKV